MKRIITAILVLLSLFLTNDTVFSLENVKSPNVSGAFYPSNKEVLSLEIDNFLNKADIGEIEGDILALISPHAGYIYSGSVAAFGYKSIKSKPYKTVIILAPSHFYNFKGVSIWREGAFKTPLGEVLVDEKFSQELMLKTNLAKFIPEAFLKEHSLEVQIPFLQMVLNSFKIVPIVMGNLSISDCDRLASSIQEIIGNKKDVLVIASSDLSHYHPYNEAVNMDNRTLTFIKNLDFNGLYNEASRGNVELCGLYPVITTLILAKKQNLEGIKILKYANSGDTAGDKTSVVGYSSIAIFNQDKKEKGEANMLNIEQRKKLLGIAKQTLENYILTEKRLDFSVDDSALTNVQGAFVTLTKKGELRGCIGRIIADKALFQVVRDMAIEAAVRDPRFPPVTKTELPDIEIEISVLSPFERIDDVNKIEVGVHGIMMKKGFNSGLLLPQVASEYSWDRNTFLEHTCYKAGLSSDCWKETDTQIYIFSAEVFSEKNL